MAIATKKYNITASHEVFTGFRKVIRWTVRDEDDVAVDITGMEFHFAMVETGGDSNSTKLLEQDNDAFTIVNAAGGVVDQVFTAVELPHTLAGTHDYQLSTTGAEGDVVAEGTFVVRPGFG